MKRRKMFLVAALRKASATFFITNTVRDLLYAPRMFLRNTYFHQGRLGSRDMAFLEAQVLLG
jgi:hypothetical protein